jgi:hypothetical protein
VHCKKPDFPSPEAAWRKTISQGAGIPDPFLILSIETEQHESSQENRKQRDPEEKSS